MSERDYYDILGLQPDADGMAVNRTYWLLARKYQEQAENDPRARLLLDELNEAYNVLGTPSLRAGYDAERPPSANAFSQNPTKAPSTSAGGAVAGTISAVGALTRRLMPRVHREPVTSADRSVNAAAGPPAFREDRGQEQVNAPPFTRRNTSADALRLSTASMVERWRSSAAGVGSTTDPILERTPDPTLVDIFRSEEDIATPSEPLSAALEILRGSRHPV